MGTCQRNHGDGRPNRDARIRSGLEHVLTRATMVRFSVVLVQSRESHEINGEKCDIVRLARPNRMLGPVRKLIKQSIRESPQR